MILFHGTFQNFFSVIFIAKKWFLLIIIIKRQIGYLLFWWNGEIFFYWILDNFTQIFELPFYFAEKRKFSTYSNKKSYKLKGGYLSFLLTHNFNADSVLAASSILNLHAIRLPTIPKTSSFELKPSDHAQVRVGSGQ